MKKSHKYSNGTMLEFNGTFGKHSIKITKQLEDENGEPFYDLQFICAEVDYIEESAYPVSEEEVDSYYDVICSVKS